MPPHSKTLRSFLAEKNLVYLRISGNCIGQIMNSTRFLVLLLTVITANAFAADPMPLWPNGAPGEKGDIGEERDTSKPGEGLVNGKPVIRIGNVSVPTITLYRPPRRR